MAKNVFFSIVFSFYRIKDSELSLNTLLCLILFFRDRIVAAAMKRVAF